MKLGLDTGGVCYDSHKEEKFIMKLKKIASLALAGIMAVSMLAGCKDGSSSSEPTNPVTPVTDAAAVVNGELDNNEEKISFTDNTVLADLIANYYKENPIKSTDWTAGTTSLTGVGTPALLNAAQKMLGVNATGANLNDIGTNNTSKETYLDVYYVNSDFVTKNDALRMAGQLVDGLNLPADNKTTPGGITVAATHDYSYTGSVAAIEAESKGGTESVWVIAIVITQTASEK